MSSAVAYPAPWRATSTQPRSPRPDTDFPQVWWSELVSQIGNGAPLAALPVQIYREPGSTLATALVGIAGALLAVVAGQFAGM